MRLIFARIGLFVCLAISACSPKSEHSLDVPTESVGADRDIHGCIGSAGYSWSELTQECVRLWEVGTVLNDARDPDATLSAYLISACEGAFLELFLPTSDAVQLELGQSGIWTSKTGDYFVKSGPNVKYSVYNSDGQLLFQSEHIAHKEVLRNPNDDILSEFGKVVSVEDGAYPMFSVSIEFPKRDMQVSFSLNVEAVAIDPSDLTKMVGEYVSINYTSELETDLADMLLDGVSLVGNTDGIQEHWVEITGVLDGADAPTMSDLPGMVYLDVTGHDRMSFEYYITDEMVAANGKEVSVYYVSQGKNKITKIEVSKE